MTHGHESDHEQATIERLQLLGYEYLPGPDIDFMVVAIDEPAEEIRCNMVNEFSIGYGDPILFRGANTLVERVQ